MADVAETDVNNHNDREYRPRHLTLQWHITDHCNLRCQHCYQDNWKGKKTELAELIQIAEKLLSFYQILSRDKYFPLLITLTGGEPFTQPGFMDLLHYLRSHPARPHLAILTSGVLITHRKAQALAKLNLAFIQMSVEGSEKIHNAIRGENNLAKVIQATHYLRLSKIRVLWSFTAHKSNHQYFGDVARLAVKHNVSRLWLDRMIPCRDSLPQALTTQETQRLFRNMFRVKQQFSKTPFITRICNKISGKTGTEISMLRALQFQWSGDRPYRCQAGEGLLTIMPEGTVYPCRRLPVAVGNIHQTPLMEIYQTSPFLQKLRNFSGPDECKECQFNHSCRGGLRCLAYAVKRDPFAADPGCHFATDPTAS